MKERIQSAFEEIHAEEALVKKTAAYLREQREKQEALVEQRPRRTRFRAITAFAMALVLVMGIFSYQTYFVAAAYVSLDVNPSVELTLNPMNRVIAVRAFNPSGEQLIQGERLTGKSYEAAISSLLEQMKEEGYLKEEGLVTVMVQASNEAKQEALCESLAVLITEAQAITKTTAVEVSPVSKAILEEAHGCHMSPAKYLAIQELMAADKTATLEEFRKETIQQIRQRTAACIAHEAQKEGDETHGNAQGHNGNGQNGTAKGSGGQTDSSAAGNSGQGQEHNRNGQNGNAHHEEAGAQVEDNGVTNSAQGQEHNGNGQNGAAHGAGVQKEETVVNNNVQEQGHNGNGQNGATQGADAQIENNAGGDSGQGQGHNEKEQRDTGHETGAGAGNEAANQTAPDQGQKGHGENRTGHGGGHGK